MDPLESPRFRCCDPVIIINRKHIPPSSQQAQQLPRAARRILAFAIRTRDNQHHLSFPRLTQPIARACRPRDYLVTSKQEGAVAPRRTPTHHHLAATAMSDAYERERRVSPFFPSPRRPVSLAAPPRPAPRFCRSRGSPADARAPRDTQTEQLSPGRPRVQGVGAPRRHRRHLRQRAQPGGH